MCGWYRICSQIECNFKNLFVLELANNHWGDLKRGKKIVREFAKVVKENNKSSWRKENSETESPYEGTECFEQKVVFQTDKVSFDTKLEFTILDFYPFAPHTK